MDWFSLIVRIIHTLSAIVLLGGSICLLTAVLTGLRSSLPEQTEDLLNRIRRKAMPLTHTALLLLLITGALQWMSLHKAYEHSGHSTIIQALLGTKMLLAIGLIVLLIAGRLGIAGLTVKRVTQLSILFGVLIVILAGTIRSFRLAPSASPVIKTTTSPAPPVSPASPAINSPDIAQPSSTPQTP